MQTSGEVTLLATSQNGYYFSLTQNFEPGTNTVNIPVFGYPQNAGNDTVVLTINSVDSGKIITNTVDNYIPRSFSMNCSSIKHNINSKYKKDLALNNTNWFDITLSYDATSRGATYNLYTNKIDGISFSATGKFPLTGTTIKVRVFGTGLPNSYKIKNLILYSNSETNKSTCNIQVKVPIYILGLGGAAYSPSPGSAATATALPKSKYNFGNEAYSTIKDFGGFEIIDTPSNIASVVSNAIYTNDVKIIVLQYNYNFDSTTAQVLGDFVRNGGFLLAGTQIKASTEALLNNIFEVSNITAGTVYTSDAIDNDVFPDIPDDPFFDGPFGNLAGLDWGEDTPGSTSFVNTLNFPTGLVDIFGIGTSNQITAFKHKELPFVWTGDSGFVTGVVENALTTTYPANIDKQGRPFPKGGYTNSTGNGIARTVYNSTAYANFLAWALSSIEYK